MTFSPYYPANDQRISDLPLIDNYDICFNCGHDAGSHNNAADCYEYGCFCKGLE